MSFLDLEGWKKTRLSMSDALLAEQRAVFAALDTDGDGVVSAEEFEAAYASKVIAGPDMSFANDPKPSQYPVSHESLWLMRRSG